MPPLPQLLLEAVQLIALHLVGGVLLRRESAIADFLQPHCLVMTARQPCYKHVIKGREMHMELHKRMCLNAS